ncbi:RING-H2 finger protein ATL70-like [Mercurialis annua]|uniref:RING-H2 finger protein ATL70-like n=1 Tax=Mercurialis annua TaxID=3986 RepID=UPI00215EC50D|nr:RING-H2 finger protein ATL70-like [Mercurialis annua]
MNNATLPSNDGGGGGGGGFLGDSDHNIGGFGYGIGVSIGILLLITTITLASYFCTRTHNNQQQFPRRRNRSDGQDQPLPDDHIVLDIGLDESTLKSYPKLLYSEAKLNKTDTTGSCCSICLADYKNSDMLRLLPDCEHLFHLKCVDPWLRSHPTCPICRTSPLPTPLSTPLAEVVPLAIRRD